MSPAKRCTEPKLKFILSDLHLGAGFAGQEGNPLEDFVADGQLVEFLKQARDESARDRREVELIINGDFLEFLQTPAVDQFDPKANYPKEAYFDSSEEASVKRLHLIIDGHRQVFNALSDFIHVESPQRRITIIKGNHDVNLYWPRVKSRLREVLGATGVRSSLLLFAEEFVSREKIYVEHGHQRAEKMHSYHDFLDPRHPKAPTQLYHPAGSHFFINCINEVEPEYYFVDSIKPVTALIWYALSYDFHLGAELLAKFIRHTPALVISDFTPDTPPAIFGNELLSKLEDPVKCRQLADQYRQNPTFRREFHQQVQQYLSDAVIANKSNIITEPGEVYDDPMMMAQLEQRQQRAWLRQAAEDIARQEKAQVILFGHTHQPAHELLPTGQVYINTGSWVYSRDLTAPPADAEFGRLPPSRLSPQLPEQLPYARIDYDADNVPTAQLLDFASGHPVANLTSAVATTPPRPVSNLLSTLRNWLGLNTT